MMVKYFVLLSLLVVSDFVVSTRNSGIKWKILNGSDAEEGAHPYQVSVRDFQGLHKCGGAILNPEWILTSTTCVEGARPEHLSIMVGTNSLNDGVLYKVLEVHWNTNYQWWTTQNDIGLLKVEPVVFNEKVQAIALETEFVVGDEPCTLTGWGQTSYPVGQPAGKLQRINLKTITTNECRQTYDSTKVTDNQVCTSNEAGEGACRGDSGSPLVRNVQGGYKLVGLFSWSTVCGIGHPDVFVRVSSYVIWIHSICNCLMI